MNSLLSKVLLFAAGAAAGSAVTYVIAKKKYEQYINEEVESVRETFSRLFSEQEESDAEDVEEDPNLSTYNDIIEGEGYTTPVRLGDDEVEQPYVISPDEFGEMDYAIISLTYFADGVVVNDKNKIVANVDELIGEESLTHFGEYEDDSVFVRNDGLKIDFEILRDYRNYSEIS